MGAGVHGGFGGTAGSPNEIPIEPKDNVKKPDKAIDGQVDKHTIGDNADKMKKEYPLSPGGYFGEKGDNVRVIKTSTPEATSSDFYKKLADGGHSEPLSNGHGTKTTLPDGSIVVHRLITSTSGSPAVDIKVIGTSKVKSQKVHFVKEGK